MLDIDATQGGTPQIDSKESHNHIHTVALNRRAVLKIPPTPLCFLYHNVTVVIYANTPRCKNKRPVEKNFCKKLKVCVTFRAFPFTYGAYD